ncbi:hypothetical protein HDU90_002294 [Geranomyces variabilis]|nr:hypothetical protein HDU90_002294 [Geranomyces variabilis]
MLVPSRHRVGRLWDKYHLYVEVHELREEGEQAGEGGSAGPSSAAAAPPKEAKGKGRAELDWDEEEEPAATEEETAPGRDRKEKGKVLAGPATVAAGFVVEKTTKAAQQQQKGKPRTVVPGVHLNDKKLKLITTYIPTHPEDNEIKTAELGLHLAGGDKRKNFSLRYLHPNSDAASHIIGRDLLYPLLDQELVRVRAQAQAGDPNAHARRVKLQIYCSAAPTLTWTLENEMDE